MKLFSAPRLAKMIRSVGFFVCRMAVPFTPEHDEDKFYRKLLALGEWHYRLGPFTDKEISIIVARHPQFDFPCPSEAYALVDEIVVRLSRSEGGPNIDEDSPVAPA